MHYARVFSNNVVETVFVKSINFFLVPSLLYFFEEYCALV